MHELEPVRRPLSAAQRRLLADTARRLRTRRSFRQVVMIAGLISGSIVGLLWLATMLVSDAPWLVITVFWLVLWAVFWIWSVLDVGKDARAARAQAERYESALRRNEADVIDVRSSEYVQFEEYEDEGAGYAFALEQGGVLVLQGQQYYPSARFPSLDFSLVTPLDEEGRPVEELIDKRGPKAEPSRVIPARSMLEFEFPQSLTILDVPLDEVERHLRGGDYAGAGQAS